MNATQDENFVPAKLAVLNTDTVQGTNLVRIAIDEATRAMRVNTTATISFTMLPIAPRDENYRACATFTGSDGLVYPFVADSDGRVLIDT